MKKFFLMVMLAVSYCAYSQEIKDEKDLKSFMDSLTPEQKDSIEVFKTLVQESMEESLKSQQVHSIGGIPFGISRDDALSRLKNKYGEPEYNPKSTVLTFKHIKYAGRDFSSVHFLFESDGIKSYLNACIFVKDAKTKSEANKLIEALKNDLEKKYNVSSAEGENGFMTYGGGISPVWDGKISTFKDEYFTAWHTDVIEYESNLSDVFGIKYGVRLIYGPYRYINEEF